MWTSFKDFIEFVTVLLLFYVLVFWPQAHEILVPQPGIQSAPPALEGEVLTTGPPGKFQAITFLPWIPTESTNLMIWNFHQNAAHDEQLQLMISWSMVKLYLYHAQLLKDLIFQRYVNFSLQIITSSTILSAYVVIFPLRLPWTSHCRFTLYLSVPQMPPTPYGLPNCLTQPTGLLASETQLGESCSWPKGSCAYSPERYLLGEPDFSRTQKILPETLLLYLQYGI